MNYTTAINLIQSSVSSLGFVLAGILAGIVAILVGLLGLGMGLRKIRRHITGVDLAANNRMYAAQIRNSELLSFGDKVQTTSSWL